MKKLYAFASIVVVFLLCICGCQKKEVKKEEPIFLAGSTYGAGREQTFVQFKDSREYGIDTSESYIERDDVAKEITPFFSEGGIYEYQFSRMLLKTTIEGEYGEFYSGYNEYYSEEEEIYVVYRDGDDLLCAYVNLKDDLDIGTNYVTEDEAKQVAIKFLEDIYSKDVISKYTIFSTSRWQDGEYEFMFTRRVAGYNSDDTIKIVVTPQGEVFSFNAYNMYKYDELKDKILESDFKYADEKLMNKLESLELVDLSVVGKKVVTNTSGDIYIEITVEYGEEKNRIKNYFYVSVN